MLRLAPAADDAVLVVLLETQRAWPLLERVEGSPRRHLDHDIDILGGPGSWRGRICDPQHDARATEEYDIAEHGLERLRGTL